MNRLTRLLMILIALFLAAITPLNALAEFDLEAEARRVAEVYESLRQEVVRKAPLDQNGNIDKKYRPTLERKINEGQQP